MASLAPGAVRLRAVTAADLPIFYAQEDDPAANEMAAFPARDEQTFLAHWTRVLADPTLITQTILYDGQVAGNMGSFCLDGQREVCYWLGREYWGQGIATAALTAFLRQVTERPLYAHVAKHNIGSRRVLEKCGFTVHGEVVGGHVEEWVLVLHAPS